MGSLENIYHTFGALLMVLRNRTIPELQTAINNKELTVDGVREEDELQIHSYD